jgi:hypothetical protein
MNRLAVITLAVCLSAATASAAIEGAWTASTSEKHPDRIYFSTTRGESMQNGMTMPLAAFTGLTSAQLNASVMTPVQFQLRREAGVISYEGTFRNGKGAGQFTFQSSPSALAAIRALGVDMTLDRRDRGEEETLFTLTQFDVSTTFIRSMMAEGYRVSLKDYLSMRIFDVTPDYIHEMRALGFKELSKDDLVGSKIHGVTPEYIRETRAAGWDLSLKELQASRIHGATPEFAAEMKKLGYGLSHDDLIAFRIHGVSAKFIEAIRKAGYASVPAKQLIAMRIHGVTPEFIAEIDRAGYEKVPIEKLIAMKIHGVDGKFLTSMSR